MFPKETVFDTVKVIAYVDAEIARLQRVRTILTDALDDMTGSKRLSKLASKSNTRKSIPKVQQKRREKAKKNI
jgi:hypothetical protein